jgi:hypothetical protein
LTEFTFSRYLPPFLQGYKGIALFLDADMVVRADIEELFQLADDQYAVQVVATPKIFERPSLMLFNCAKCTALTPEFIESDSPQALQWGRVGYLPPEWNNCIGYEPADENAKIVHYTTGIPCFEEVQGLGHEDTWRDELRGATRTVPWADIMGQSVHAEHLKAKRAEGR